MCTCSQADDHGARVGKYNCPVPSVCTWVSSINSFSRPNSWNQERSTPCTTWAFVILLLGDPTSKKQAEKLQTKFCQRNLFKDKIQNDLNNPALGIRLRRSIAPWRISGRLKGYLEITWKCDFFFFCNAEWKKKKSEKKKVCTWLNSWLCLILPRKEPERNTPRFSWVKFSQCSLLGVYLPYSPRGTKKLNTHFHMYFKL